MSHDEIESRRTHSRASPPPPPPEEDPGVSASAGFTSKSFEFLRCQHGVRWHRATLLCPLTWPVLILVGIMMLIVQLLEEVFERKRDG